jgi:hypothetical protein
MEQRRYSGSITPQALADYLVEQYNPKEDLQAQRLGEGESVIVQIGRGDQPEEIRDTVTVSITRRPDGQAGVMVTMGQQQWLTPKAVTFAAAMGLIGLLVTPWALFALLWPLSSAVGSMTLPGDIWNTIDLYAASQGATFGGSEELLHPHAR